MDIAGTCRGCGHGSRRKNFEETFSQRIELALFLPVIVYMSDSIGTETLALFVREMSQRKVELHRFFLREARVGLALGLLSAVPMGALRVSLVWRGPSGDNTRDRDDRERRRRGLDRHARAVDLREARKRPALGTDQITTALSDNMNMLTYLVVATLILF